MKKATAVIFIALFLIGTAMTQQAQAADKFAYVDLSKIFTEYQKTDEFDTSLTKKEEAYTQERDKQVEAIKKLQDKMSLLSEAEQEKQRKDLEAQVRALQEFRREKEGELRKEQDTMMREILKDIEQTVEKYAKQEGFTMVFNDRVLIYQTESLDITDKILELLHKK